MDAVEEVTVTGATPDASAGAQGSVQIAFATRSGSNRYDTSIYHYYRSPAFNTNYDYNEIAGLPKNQITVHQFGGRVGGPIKPGKAFFFFNYEQFHLPNSATRTRTPCLQPQGLSGVFRHDVAGSVTSVNVLTWLRKKQLASVDPTIGRCSREHPSATGKTGSVLTTTNLNTQTYTFQPPSVRNEYAPTSRVDFNLSSKHRLTGTYLWQRIKSAPDFLNSSEPAFPSFRTGATSIRNRTTGSGTLRSTSVRRS
jgi:hypothetical protein